LIAAASVASDLTPIGVSPKNLEQTRPLARLKPEQRREAWEGAQKKANGKPVTAKALENEAARIAPKDRSKLLDSSNAPTRSNHQPPKPAEVKPSTTADGEIRIVQPLGDGRILSWKIAESLEQTIARLSVGEIDESCLFVGTKLVALIVANAEGHGVAVRRDQLVSIVGGGSNG
jgi:hypothetical protein